MDVVVKRPAVKRQIVVRLIKLRLMIRDVRLTRQRERFTLGFRVTFDAVFVEDGLNEFNEVGGAASFDVRLRYGRRAGKRRRQNADERVICPLGS